jgi:hypothetical protein
VPILALAALVTAVAGSGTLAGAAGSSARSAGTYAPNRPNIDCNSFASENPLSAVRPGLGALCTDPFHPESGGGGYRALDNGHYVGHDEPSVKFISSAPNSANNMTYYMKLAKDPTTAPTPLGSVSDYAMLSIAPWFGLPMCDPNSYPQNPCTPDSDTNTGLGAPSDAGAAFLEVQFYPPHFGPFLDAVSCNQTHYCAAMTIDSLECTFGFGACNPNCFEPVNFSYIQRDGVPPGPPSPQLQTFATFNPNGETLLMNEGDAVRVHIQDSDDGLEVEVDDLTTGQTGFMVASAANGFMNTDVTSCNGAPFDFHPEYNTAAKQNQVPWAALEGGVLMEQEIGHSEGCGSVRKPLGLSIDPKAAQVCVNGTERRHPDEIGEGPCTPSGCADGHSENHDCTASDEALGLCELSDALCAPAGPRTVHMPDAQVWTWPMAMCLDTVFQNGDLDFDGNGYRHDWPDGGPDHPTPFAYAGPFDSSGAPYPTVQFESDAPASESSCDTETGTGCQVPPVGAAFYPFWTIGTQDPGFPAGPGCYWNFGEHIHGVTTDSLDRAAQYGSPDVARFAGTVISPEEPNPQLTSACMR